MHFTEDKKINTIHDINTYVKKGSIIKLSKSKKILSIVNKILNEKSSVRNIEFFSKPKKTGLKSPYHQDNYYWKFKDKKALNVWIACNKANKSNGGVGYFVGSHKLGLKKHITSYAPGSSYKIPDTFIKKIKNKKVYPSLNSGDVCIHHCEIIHGSSKNDSKKNREGLVISYKAYNSKPDKSELKRYRENVARNLKHLKKKNAKR